MGDKLLLVGSIPLDTPVDVFEACEDTVAPYLPGIPDGETNERIWWVNMLCLRVFQHHPDIRTLTRPPKDALGYPRWKPAGVEEMWTFELLPGTGDLKFADLCYAYDAQVSYKIFRMMRDAGRLPRGLRFMVCLPMTNSAVDLFFRKEADRELVRAAFEAAMRREIEQILRVIPPEDLMIQWDVCVEVLDIEGYFPWSRPERAYERNTAAFGAVSPAIPTDVQLGYHFCYGTLGGWPMLKPRDLSLCVRLAHTACLHSGRRVDYVHMPVPRHCSGDYLQPLEGLDIGATRTYIGLIHDSDDLQSNLARVRLTKNYLKDFGVASVCGLGRLSRERVRPSLQLHGDVARALA